MVIAVGGCGATPTSPPSVQPSEVVARVDGASLERVRLPDGSVGYLQRIDVSAMRIDQVLGERDTTRPADRGSYYPGAESPRFRRITPTAMQNACRSRYGMKAFSAVNFSFFEEYDDSTRLSFPVQTGSALVSAGSSPYGPVAAPKHPHYRTITLKALQWDEHKLGIADYDPATGAPLNRRNFREGLVTYAYADHPSFVLSKDPANRYQLLGALDDRQLLILTVEHTTLAQGADLLRQQGVRGDILTFDGGVSTFLWSGTAGNLVDVSSKDGALPHYLCVHQVMP
jgi:hypothetical protein